ncbi:MAG: hypothetical protein ACI4TX_02030 [Christensenellales bacterium]
MAIRCVNLFKRKLLWWRHWSTSLGNPTEPKTQGLLKMLPSK